MRYVHAAQDEPAPLGERMHIVALPDAQGGRIERARHSSAPFM